MAKNQKFTIKTFKRSEINLAEYNPRIIKPKNKNNLGVAIKRHGLVTPLIVNLKTMNLCGGHQRIQEIDILEDYPKNDYELDFSCIEVGEKEEKAINLMLNNKNLQGDFDGELLSALSMDGFDLAKDGFFTDVELKVDFGIISNNERSSQVVEEKEVIKESPEEIKDMEQPVLEDKAINKEQKENIKEDNVYNGTKDYTVTLIFESNKEKEILVNNIGNKGDQILYYSKIKEFLRKSI